MIKVTFPQLAGPPLNRTAADAGGRAGFRREPAMRARIPITIGLSFGVSLALSFTADSAGVTALAVCGTVAYRARVRRLGAQHRRPDRAPGTPDRSAPRPLRKAGEVPREEMKRPSPHHAPVVVRRRPSCRPSGPARGTVAARWSCQP